jgi:hypothetical protein
MAAPKTNQRKSPRRMRGHAAWISFADKVGCHDCRVLDLSQEGAKLLADVVTPIGSRLFLSSEPRRFDRRECEVMWQKNRTVGVRFVGPH